MAQKLTARVSLFQGIRQPRQNHRRERVSGESEVKTRVNNLSTAPPRIPKRDLPTPGQLVVDSGHCLLRLDAGVARDERHESQSGNHRHNFPSSVGAACFALTELEIFLIRDSPKAPGGWRTPRRFAISAGPGDFRRMATFRLARQRLGLRRPSAAFSRRHNHRDNVQLNLPRVSAIVFSL